MSECNSLQPLVKVSTEVEESQTKLDLVNFCIKAQQDLAYKLRKEAQRRKENCSFVKNTNLQLESEIRHAECELKSLTKSYETIKSANVELKKDLLLQQNFNMELVEQMKEGEKKYENLWLESKRRFESIPYVQKWLTVSDNLETLKNNVNALEIEAKILQDEIKSKKRALQEEDMKRVIKLAEFFVHEMPQKQQTIREKTLEVKELEKEIEKQSKQSLKKLSRSLIVQSPTPKKTINSEKCDDDGWPTLEKESNDDSLPMPKIRLASTEVDVLSVKLELNKVFNLETTSIKRTSSITDCTRNVKPRMEENQNNDYISSYFNKATTITNLDNSKETTENFSDRKLINILEDIHLDNHEAYEIVSKVNPVQLTEIDAIGDNTVKNNINRGSKNKVLAPMESDEIEEVDLTASSEFQNLIMPPSQFVDLTQENIMRSSQKQVEVIVHMDMGEMQDVPREKHPQMLKSSQETKKKVSFDIPMTIQEDNNQIENLDNSEIANTTNETVNSQFDGDISAAMDENYMKLKDMILKKHHLDMSPQFIYAKNSVLQKKPDEEITSKFFDNANQSAENEQPKLTSEDPNPNAAEKDNGPQEEMQNIQTPTEKPVEDAVIEETVTSPGAANTRAEPVTGMLFTHGPQGIPESLDVSMSTTGFDDGDGDYAHCLDNSLLLSPKAADISMSTNNENKNEIDSQELPNFLTGFRKTGLSFFEKSSKENAPESSGENNFNFNFGSQEKKRGGLFSFFQ